MYRLAVVTPDPSRDATSREILAVRHDRARLSQLDLYDLRLAMGDGLTWSRRGDPGLAYDGFIVRRFNGQGSFQLQFELLELLQRGGSLVINSAAALSLAESKLQTSAVLAVARIPVPPTLFTQDLEGAFGALGQFGVAVIKPLYGELGLGIERIDSGVDPAWLAEQLEIHGGLYVQKYLSTDGVDLRALVVGDRVVGAMQREAAGGEWRTNIHLGGRGIPVSLPPSLSRLAVRATQALGLDYAGVDLIEAESGPVILEVNGTPGWLGLEAATGCDVAAAIVDHTVARLDGAG
jgi:RimK family alpha-L-glutamate ligase